MNFDFEKHWDTVILPLILNNQKVRRSLKQAILKFIPHSWKGLVYDPKRCPASYGKTDGWSTYMMEYEEKLEQELLELGILEPDLNAPDGEGDDEDEFDYYNNDNPNRILYETYKQKVMEPFIRHHEKTSIRAYQMYMSCHWSNPTFGFTLAKVACPSECWHVRRGDLHTTVVNSDGSKVFDILYFEPTDDTKGGKLALTNSASPPKKILVIMRIVVNLFIHHNEPNCCLIASILLKELLEKNGVFATISEGWNITNNRTARRYYCVAVDHEIGRVDENITIVEGRFVLDVESIVRDKLHDGSEQTKNEEFMETLDPRFTRSDTKYEKEFELYSITTLSTYLKDSVGSGSDSDFDYVRKFAKEYLHLE